MRIFMYTCIPVDAGLYIPASLILRFCPVLFPGA